MSANQTASFTPAADSDNANNGGGNQGGTGSNHGRGNNNQRSNGGNSSGNGASRQPGIYQSERTDTTKFENSVRTDTSFTSDSCRSVRPDTFNHTF